jgi:hypothetical protein
MNFTEREKEDIRSIIYTIEQEREGCSAIECILDISESLIEKLKDLSKKD